MSVLIHTDTVVEPDFLGVGIKVETYQEPLENDKFFLYYIIVMWFGADKSISVHTEPTYLKGKYEGFEQTLKVEVPADVLEKTAKLYHELGINVAEATKDLLKLKFFAEIAKHL